MKKYFIADIIPYYQPIVDLKSGEVAMHECLARFVGSDGKRLSPAELSYHFDDAVFLWELFEAIFPKLTRHACNSNIISVNVDVCSITERFFHYIEAFFNKFPNLVNHINFEVTERNIGKNIAQLCEYVTEIQKLGAKVVLDDFGTGGANIECLESVRFDHVKIDGQFLKAAVISQGGHRRLQIIVDLLKSYNVPIVAEHIENDKIESIAKLMGIDYAQGYLYGTPTPLLSKAKYPMANKLVKQDVVAASK